MAKYKFKPTPAGILFLAAIAVLVIALITVVIVLAANCNKSSSKPPVEVTTSAPATEAPSATPLTTPAIITTVDPSLNPLDTPDPNATEGTATNNPVVVNTPGSATTTATASATSYPTSPTSAMKNSAQKGHVTADDVNMRKGPSKDYNSIKKVSKNTNVTLYKEYNGWWFLKCGSDYGYIKNDYIAKGEAASTKTGDVAGTVNGTKVALRKGAAKTYECIKEYAKGEAVTIHYKSSDGNWYYVTVKSDGKKGWMYADYVKASGKVGTKSN